MKQAKKENEFDMLTRKAVADAFGVSVRTVSNWVSAGCPRRADGRYRLQEVISWRVDQLSMVTGPAEPASPSLERFRAARASVAEIELAEKKGKLVPYGDVIEAWAHRIVIVTRGLESLMSRLPGLLEGRTRPEIQEILKNEFAHLRRSYAQRGRYCPPPDGELVRKLEGEEKEIAITVMEYELGLRGHTDDKISKTKQKFMKTVMG